MASLLDLPLVYGWLPILEPPEFSTGVENMGGSSSKFDSGGGLSQYMEGAWGGLKMLSKNACE